MTTPEKFYFDEVHYVPAARQMLEPVLPSPLLNPMHPPLAKELMAVSIRVFGDVPLGWRYPSVLFGSLAIVAMCLCGLALVTAQGPAVASALIAFFNQMVFVQSRIAMLDISALAFGLLAIAAFISGFQKRRPHVWFALAGLAFGPSIARKWSGLFALAICVVIVAVVRCGRSGLCSTSSATVGSRPSSSSAIRWCRGRRCRRSGFACATGSWRAARRVLDPGPYLAWAMLPRTLGFIYYYLPSATTASLALAYALRRGNSPRWPLWAFVATAFAGFAAMLPISAAFVGTSMETFNRLMIFQNWI